MLWPTALSAASRAARRDGLAPSLYLELGRPPPNLPVGGEEFAAGGDLKVAGIANPALSWSLPDGHYPVT